MAMKTCPVAMFMPRPGWLNMHDPTRKTMKTTRLSIFLLACGSPFAFAATVITNNNRGGNPGNNYTVASDYASNVSASNSDFTTSLGTYGFTGTPNIALLWEPHHANPNTSPAASTGNWEHHGSWGNAANSGGGVLQMDTFTIGRTYSITFAPDAGYGVVLNSFNFIGDTNSSNTYSFTVNIVDVAADLVVLTKASGTWNTATGTAPFNNAPAIALDYTGDLGKAYRLDIVRLDTGANAGANDIAIDNISFDQHQIPEPATSLLGAFGALALLRRRR